jgi:peroxiredoxin
MAVESEIVPLGTPMPTVSLPDVHGTSHSLLDLRGTGVLVVMFSANHCPYVKRIENAFGAVADEYSVQGASFAAICSNDVVAYADDDVPGLTEQATRAGWHFPYLIDRDQTAAKQFGAVCTPDIFVYDVTGKLAYRGAFDAATPGNDLLSDGADLRAVLDQLTQARPYDGEQRRSIGCSIKWRAH